jgi:hypothetical protein
MTDCQSCPVLFFGIRSKNVVGGLTILPYQYTHLITYIVEDVGFKEPSPPYSDHVLISFHLIINIDSIRHVPNHGRNEAEKGKKDLRVIQSIS